MSEMSEHDAPREARTTLARLDQGGLDPGDWEAFRGLGHRAIDDLVALWSSLDGRPAWQPIPEDVLERLGSPAPEQPLPPAQVYDEFRRDILPYRTGNIHPTFFSHVIGTGTPVGALAELLAAGINCNLFGGHQAACHVERQVVSWFASLLGLPADAGGLLFSGGSMANIVALAVALRERTDFDVRRRGLCATERRPRIYCSSETHNCIDKGADFLGLGSESVRRIPADEEFRLSIGSLEAAIEEDRAAGWQPLAVVGNAVSVGTGAIDPLAAIAELCRRQGLWFHVDGAIGAVGVLSPTLAPKLAGLERADSIAFDLHKWLYVPYEAGCLLVRDVATQQRAFSNATAYLSVLDAGLSSGDSWPNQLGPELSRGFKALKVWMSIKEHGLSGYRRAIETNVQQAFHLGQLIEATPALELLTPVTANIVCYRFVAKDLTDKDTDLLNRRIVEQLHVRGLAVPSHTFVRGRFAIRVAITNHRTRRSHLDALVAASVELGEELRDRGSSRARRGAAQQSPPLRDVNVA
jgi:aromatic-L-amino-acid/L-tryptophan decarboxylase